MAAVTPFPAPDTALEAAEKLGAEITELCSCIYAAEAKLLRLLREFDAGECAQRIGFSSTGHWLNYQCGLGMTAAREKVRVARALGGLPKLEAAMARGELSYSKVRAVTRIADETNEEYLLMIATYGTAHHVEKLVRLYRTARSLNDPEQYERSHRERELHWYTDETGALVIRGRLPAEQGALFIKAIEHAMEADYRDSDGQSAEQDASLDDSSSGEVTAVTPQRVPLGQRRADALVDVARTYLDHPEHTASTADRYQVVVNVNTAPPCVGAASCRDSKTPVEVTAVTPEPDHIEGGPHVTAETSRRLACDGSLVRLDWNDQGEPVSIGRRSRTIPPPMKRALQRRDGGCRFPGCTRTRFVDGHHIHHWANGGETSLDNLVSLCRRHHHLVHEGGFTCERTDEGEIVFRDRREGRDRVVPDYALLHGFVDTQTLDRWFDSNVFEQDIEPEACRAKFTAGETMDWDLAVGALFQ